MSPLRKYLITASLCLLPQMAGAQLFTGNGWGANVGLVTAIGNRFQRVGVNCQGYYCYGHAQANAEIRVCRNFRNLGPGMKYNELVASLGLLAGYGTWQQDKNPFLSIVGNQTGYTHSIGYSHNLYCNRIGTTQRTGTIALQFGPVSIISENDLFARPTLDRFRTGAFLVQYQHKDQYQLALNCTMWTGQMGYKVTGAEGFPARGYMDTAGGVYTSHSHGLLSGQVKVAAAYGQVIQANAGIDAQQVRNFVQNRIFHDMVFLPRTWRPLNCHIPMLDTAGHPYLYRPGQQIKPARFYWNIFSSAALFY